MRLNELHGVKKYRDRTIDDVISDLVKSGGFAGHGRFSTVIGHKNWDYVYKVFREDWAYLKFVDFVLKNPQSAFPRFYGPPRLVTPFYSRAKQEDQVFIIKMERLIPIQKEDAIEFVNYIEKSGHYLPYLLNPDAPDLADKRKKYLSLRRTRAEFFRQHALGNTKSPQEIRRMDREYNDQVSMLTPYPHLYDFEQAVVAHPSLLNAFVAWQSTSGIEAAPDLHSENIMMRPGSFDIVLTDPFWHGSTPYMDYDAWAKEQGDHGEYEPEMVRGGERYKKPEPTPWQPPPDGDIPF